MSGAKLEGHLNPQPEAVTYLRVSSVRQTQTAIDIDADGNSIATQREACHAKAGGLGAAVTREFIEPGKSAQSIEKRPVFRELLAYLRAPRGRLPHRLLPLPRLPELD